MGLFTTEDPADAPSWLENDFFECNQTYWGHFLEERKLNMKSCRVMHGGNERTLRKPIGELYKVVQA